MTLRQAYLATFRYLSCFYYKTKDEKLGDMLSSMNPFLFVESDPNNPDVCETADPAIWFDWMAIVNRITKENQLDSKQTYDIMVDFLKFNKDEFDFAPGWLVEKLERKTHNTSKWLECVSKAME